MPRKALDWGTNWVETTVVMRHMPPNIAPNETGSDVTE